MDFDEQEHENDVEEMGSIPPPPGYESVRGCGEGARKGTMRYRECLKNHAVGMGGHSVDGCGEFLAAGDEGTLDALKCAACNCHRNFHRKESQYNSNNYHHQQQQQQIQHQQLISPYYRPPPPAGYLHMGTPQAGGHHHHRPLALPAGGGEVEEDVSNNPSSSGGGSGSSRKRHRTKFTPEQKEKMLAFAERLGWRIQKQEEAAVEQFCAETEVKRQVLKVWMHNNKHTLGKKP